TRRCPPLLDWTKTPGSGKSCDLSDTANKAPPEREHVLTTEERGLLARLAEEQAALRRLAALIALQPSAEEVFIAVSEAVGSVLGADVTAIVEFHDQATGAVVASWSGYGPKVPVGTPMPLDIDTVTARVFHTAATARIDAYPPGAGAEAARSQGVRA